MPSSALEPALAALQVAAGVAAAQFDQLRAAHAEKCRYPLGGLSHEDRVDQVWPSLGLILKAEDEAFAKVIEAYHRALDDGNIDRAGESILYLTPISSEHV